MRRVVQGSQARIGSPADRDGGRRAEKPAWRRFAALSDANSDSKQEALWAKLMAERPDMLSEIVTFIQGARLRITETPRPSRRVDPRSDDA
jgi:hypothetical protein